MPQNRHGEPGGGSGNGRRNADGLHPLEDVRSFTGDARGEVVGIGSISKAPDNIRGFSAPTAKLAGLFFSHSGYRFRCPRLCRLALMAEEHLASREVCTIIGERHRIMHSMTTLSGRT